MHTVDIQQNRGANMRVWLSQLPRTLMDVENTVKIGLIGDIQYCNRDDGQNYGKTCTRRYRQSLATLKKASGVFSNSGTSFNIILGDVIDGKAKKDGNQVPSLLYSSRMYMYLLLYLDSSSFVS